MRDGITEPMQAAVDAAVVRPALLVRLDYASGAQCATTAPFDIVHNGETFYGVGQFGGISQVEEGGEVQSYGLAMQLSGIPQEHLAIALGEHYTGRDCKLWLAMLDANWALIEDPLLLFRGRINTQTVDLISRKIDVAVKSRMADWERPRVRRYTHEEQQVLYPGDMAFEFTARLENQEIVWGKA